MATETEDQLQRLAESQANTIHQLRRDLTLAKDAVCDERDKLVVLEKRLVHHTAMHAQLLKWLRANSPDLFQRSLKELNLAE